jgi:hypothetical protein
MSTFWRADLPNPFGVGRVPSSDAKEDAMAHRHSYDEPDDRGEPYRCAALLTAIDYGVAALLEEGFTEPELGSALGAIVGGRDIAVRGLRRGHGRPVEWRIDHGGFLA